MSKKYAKFYVLFLMLYWSIIVFEYFSYPIAQRYFSQAFAISISNITIYLLLLFLASVGIIYVSLKIRIPKKQVITPYPDTYNNLSVVVGEIHDRVEKNKKSLVPSWLTIPGKGLFTGMIIFGSTGTGKTVSFLYPFLKDLLNYKHDKPDDKIAGLILDVKGDFSNMTYNYALVYNRCKIKAYAEERVKYSGNYSSLKVTDFEYSDIIRIAVDGDYKWNPLWRPDDTGDIIASDLTIVLENLSGKDTHNQYWIDNAKKHLANTIDLLRISLYNDAYPNQPGYFTFDKLYLTIISVEETQKHFNYARDNLNSYGENDVLNKAFIEYLEKYFFQDYGQLEERIRKIIESEINRMLNFFSKPRFAKTFCPKESEARKSKYFFPGFKECINKGIIVVGDLPVAKYSGVAVTISILLKQAFRKAALERINELNYNRNYNISRPLLFMCDEYQNFISPLDADLFDKSRQAKVIPIVATQTLSSLLNAVNKDQAVKVIMDNLANKIFLRTTSQDTADWASKLSGVIERIRLNRSINQSNSNKNNSFSSLLFGTKTQQSNDSRSLNVAIQKNKEFLFEANDFLQLDTFQAILSQGSDGYDIIEPTRVYSRPHFFKKNLDYFANMQLLKENEEQKSAIKIKLHNIIHTSPIDIQEINKILKLTKNNHEDVLINALYDYEITLNATLDLAIKTYFSQFIKENSHQNEELEYLLEFAQEFDDDALLSDLEFFESLNDANNDELNDSNITENSSTENESQVNEESETTDNSADDMSIVKVDVDLLLSNVANTLNKNNVTKNLNLTENF